MHFGESKRNFENIQLANERNADQQEPKRMREREKNEDDLDDLYRGTS